MLACSLLLSGCFAGVKPDGSQGGTTFPVGGNSSNSGDSSNSGNSSVDNEHTDKNDDGKCDDCGEGVLEIVDFYAINDLHGKFADTDNQPGVDELTTYLKNAKNSNDNTVFLSSGDMWQGSPESNLTKGKILNDWMSEMEFASMTLGNHEFDWGESYIAENAEEASFPYLAINVYENATNTLVDYCQPSVMIERGEAKIGIIGAIGNCYSSISSDKVSEIHFKTGSALTALVKAEANKLRAAGADCIVYSLHDGYEESSYSTGSISDSQLTYYDVALSEGYVDLVFESHTHQRYVLKDSKSVYHLQGGGDNDGITHAKLEINVANGNTFTKKAEFISTSVYSSLQDDAIVSSLMNKYADEIGLANKVLGNNARYRSSNELRRLVAQLYYEAGIERWGKDYDIALGGGFLSVRSPYNLQAGEVTYGQLQMIFPFDNPLVLCTIPGRYLKSQFFETTNSNYFIYYGDYGAEVRDNIDVTKTYYIVIDTYSSLYSPNHATEIARYDNVTFARDLLAKYIENGGMAG